ncbi:MAG: hypothetical protein JWL72_2063 [Ilumatobacteraceae bacterium]|nr:hypothetical protein [Ilumatobacteraceae bacterium]
MWRTRISLVLVVPLLAAVAEQVVPPLADVPPAYAYTSSEIVGPARSQYFGSSVLVLTNGNYAVSDPGWDSPSKADVGAVYLYNGMTNALISTLTGSSTGDAVGSSLVEVGNSNFVVISSNWTSIAAAAGAVTWVSGTTGLNGFVSITNSLFGTYVNSRVGGTGVVVLANGNYVVTSPDWNQGGVALRLGAATWGSGNGPTVGAVTSTNSFVGNHDNDNIGNYVVPLSNGHYVVTSSSWNGARGASAWGNGVTGTSGVITSGNAITGANLADQIGSGGVTALTNGNYVVGTLYINRGGNPNVGASTWGNGSTAGPRTTGVVTDSNSMFGTYASDALGSRVVPLTNGNYVIVVQNFSGGYGAVVWVNGAVGITGYITGTNALFGQGSLDGVGSSGVLALTNGNFVVLSPNWRNGSMLAAGAVTWVNGATGLAGPITTANSLTGSVAGANVGSNGVALSNGNYAFASSSWHSPTGANVGALTWGNGTIPASGTVSAANSMVGSTNNDLLGADGLTALTNGNYVARSEYWHNGAGVAVGAVTWQSGSGPSTGVVGPTNSLVGSQADDQVDRGNITPLLNGNFLATSSYWGNGAVKNAGAVTWGAADGTTVGAVSAANSLVGSATDDRVGSEYAPNIPLANGGYIVFSQKWHAEYAAISLGGQSGRHGVVNSTNSLLGTQTFDLRNVSARPTAAGLIPVGRPDLQKVTMLRFDALPPVFAQPPNVTAQARAGTTSTVVNYPIPTATANIGAPTIGCTPPSGSSFPVGTTTVTCTATNLDEQFSTTSFTVTVVAGTDYVALAPGRLADTRTGQPTIDGLFAGEGPRAAGSSLQLVVGGRGGVPTDATAVVLNVTATEPGGSGFVTVYPCGVTQPTASNLNFAVGATIPNAVITKIGAGGSVCLFTSQPVHLVVDVNGYFPSSTTYAPINPARVLDTRPGQSTSDGVQAGSGAVAAGSITFVQITGRVGVPSDARAVVLNVTVTEPAANGYATVYPCGTTPPTASNLNYTAGLTIPNLAISKIGVGGNVCIFSQAGAHLIADVDGYFAMDTTYAALTPARVLDTRVGSETVDGLALGAGLLPPGTVTVLHVAGRGGVPDGARTAVLNVTATEAVEAGFITVYPCNPTPPVASNLNYVAGQTVPNAVVTQIGAGGDVCLFNSQATHLIADVNGYVP